jgi:4-amino-4-deoxy-L-arabinose transferase-like glycosyltransferase
MRTMSTTVRQTVERVESVFTELEKSTRLQLPVLGAITLIGAVLRFYKLGEWSFWIDEVLSAERAMIIFERLSNGEFSLMGHPLTLMSMHVPIAILGMSEWSVRLAPAIIGILSVPILYFPVRKMFGTAVAIVTSLLLATSPWHLVWSQSGRFYALLLLFYTLALLTFYIGMEQNKFGYLVLSLILMGLAATERLLALHIVPVVMGYLIMLVIFPSARPVGVGLRKLGLIVLLGAIPAFIVARPWLLNPSRWIGGFGTTSENLGALNIVKDYMAVVSPAILGMGGLGVLVLIIEKNRGALLLAMGACFPPLVIVVASFFQFSATRYAFVSLTSWIILASVAAVTLIARSQKNGRFLAVGALFILLLVDPFNEVLQYYASPSGGRANWKASFEYVRNEMEPDEMVVTNKPRLGRYYLQQEVIGMEEIVPEISPEVIVKESKRVWFVVGGTSRVDAELERWIRENCTVVFPYSSWLRVHLYDPGSS